MSYPMFLRTFVARTGHLFPFKTLYHAYYWLGIYITCFFLSNHKNVLDIAYRTGFKRADFQYGIGDVDFTIVIKSEDYTSQEALLEMNAVESTQRKLQIIFPFISDFFFTKKLFRISNQLNSWMKLENNLLNKMLCAVTKNTITLEDALGEMLHYWFMTPYSWSKEIPYNRLIRLNTLKRLPNKCLELLAAVKNNQRTLNIPTMRKFQGVYLEKLNYKKIAHINNYESMLMDNWKYFIEESLNLNKAEIINIVDTPKTSEPNQMMSTQFQSLSLHIDPFIEDLTKKYLKDINGAVYRHISLGSKNKILFILVEDGLDKKISTTNPNQEIQSLITRMENAGLETHFLVLSKKMFEYIYLINFHYLSPCFPSLTLKKILGNQKEEIAHLPLSQNYFLKRVRHYLANLLFIRKIMNSLRKYQVSSTIIDGALHELPFYYYLLKQNVFLSNEDELLSHITRDLSCPPEIRDYYSDLENLYTFNNETTTSINCYFLSKQSPHIDKFHTLIHFYYEKILAMLDSYQMSDSEINAGQKPYSRT